MEQNIQKTGMVNWFALLVITGLSVILAQYAGSAAGLVGSVYLGLGFLVAAVSYFQMRLAERERFEQLEFEELKKAKADSTLFTEAVDTFPAKRSREQFERFLLPAFAVILLALQGTAAWWFWEYLDTSASPDRGRATITMSLYALFALVLFLLGKYSGGLARLKRLHLLRPGAGYLMLGAMVCFTVSVASATAYFELPRVDRYVARAFCVILALNGVETLFNLVLELYRPRVRGQEMRLLYESRLIGLLGQPTGLVTTAAQALDYQFGFKVSETWFYRFLENALAWIILLQLGVLLLSTMFVIIDPGEQGLLERFGRPVAGRPVLDPGLHFKFPWPIDQVYRFPTREIQRFTVGVVQDADSERLQTIVWTRPHSKEEFLMLVASRDPAARSDRAEDKRPVPANLLVVSIPVYYQVTNLTQWTYQLSDPSQLLENVANTEVVRYLVSVDFDQIMSVDRITAGAALRSRIQARADQLQLGAQVLFVGLQDIHPPLGNKMLPLAATFEQVVAAIEEKQSNILAALAYEAERVPAAEAEAQQTLALANSDRALKTVVAAAEAAQFTNQLAAYRASPSAYMQRVYLESLARAIAPVRKYVLMATNTADVLVFDLQEKIRSDLASGVILPPDALKPPGAKP